MKISVIICAAGKGERAGMGKNKLLVPLYGAPVLYHTLAAFEGRGEIFVTANEDDREQIAAVAAPFGAHVVQGGATRTESVYNALAHCTGDAVLIHDGARPFVTDAVIDGCIESIQTFGSGICAVQATDTVALCRDGNIESVPDRRSVCNIQTPQGFRLQEIRTAYDRAIRSGLTFTDDSSVYARYVGAPHVCAGSPENRKLTYRNDFPAEYAPAVAAEGQAVGIGTDVHCFGKAQDFVTLCGVKVPCDSGLIAHSDGDVAVHAVMDALLSACGLKDIGHYFPDTDGTFAGADSMRLLERVVALASDAGYAPVNLSLTIQAEKPRLAAHIGKMKANLAAALGIGADRVGVAAGTCEGLGFVGKGLGICATACILMRRTTNG